MFKYVFGLVMLGFVTTASARVEIDGSSTVYPIMEAVAEEFINRDESIFFKGSAPPHPPRIL